MKRILSLLFVLVAGISLLCGGTYLFCGQELFSPQTENEVKDEDLEEDEEVVTPTASGYWNNSSYYATSFAGGSGTSSDPWQIATAAQLAGMAYRVNNTTSYRDDYYTLTADIDISAHYWVPIACKGDVQPFTGSFEGNGYVISGLCFDQMWRYNSSWAYLCGLFGGVQDATITRVNVSNVYANTFSYTEETEYYFGGLVAYAYGATKISYCSVTNYSGRNLYVKGINNTAAVVYVGGLVGSFYSECSSSLAVIDCCSVNLKLFVSTSSYKYEYGYTGGLVGYIYNDGSVEIYVRNSYFSGSIDSYAYWGGGLFGEADSNSSKQLKIQACYYRASTTDYLSSGVCGGIAGTAEYIDIQSCLVRSYLSTGNGASTRGALVGYVYSSVWLYSSRWYSGTYSGGNAVGGGTTSTTTNCAAFSDETLATSTTYSNFYTSTSHLKGSGYYSWNFVTWIMPGSATYCKSYINGGYPMLNNINQLNSNGIGIYVGSNGTATYRYYSYGDTATTISLTVGSTTTVRAPNGGYLYLSATANTGYSIQKWVITYRGGTQTTISSSTYMLNVGNDVLSVNVYFETKKLYLYVYYDSNASTIGYSFDGTPVSKSIASYSTTFYGRTFVRDTYVYEYNASYNVTITVSTNSGYSWEGWKSASGKSSSTLSTSTSYSLAATSGYTRYAWTEPKDYILKADGNGGGWNAPSTGDVLNVTSTSTVSGGNDKFYYIETSGHTYEGYYAAPNRHYSDATYACKFSLYVPTSQYVYYTFSFPNLESGTEQALISKVDDDDFSWTYSDGSLTPGSSGYLAKYTESSTYDHSKGSLGYLSGGTTHTFTIVLKTSSTFASSSTSYQFYFKIDNAWHKSSSYMKRIIHYGEKYDLPASPDSGTYTDSSSRYFDGWYTSSTMGTGTKKNSTDKYAIFGDQTLYAYLPYLTSHVSVSSYVDGALSSKGGSFTLSYLNLNNVSTTLSTSTGASLGVKRSSTITFNPTANTGYMFAGISTSTTPPYTNTKTYSVGTSSVTLYVHFVTKSDNPLKYDATGEYFYFEDGEYPQSYVGDDMNTTLNSVLASKISETTTDSLDEYDLVRYTTLTYLAGSALSTSLTVYKYTDGNKYAKYISTSTKTLTLSTGSVTLTSGTAYWFKVEPIRWRITAEGVTVPPTTWKNFGKINTNFKVVSDRVLAWSCYHVYSSLSSGATFLDTPLMIVGKDATYFDMNYNAVYTINFDSVGYEGQQEKVDKSNSESVSGPIPVSLEELESCLADNRAKASDLVCAIAGIGTSDYCEYWTRDMYSNTSAYRIDANGKEQISWMTNSYGVRFVYGMTEGQALGTSSSYYT